MLFEDFVNKTTMLKMEKYFFSNLNDQTQGRGFQEDVHINIFILFLFTI